MYCYRILVMVILMLIVNNAGSTPPSTRAIIVQPGHSGGRLSGKWMEALRSRMTQESLDSFSSLERPLTAAEEEWQVLIASKVATWNGYRDSLAIPFRDISLPDTIYIMLGFLGNDDGFTFGPQTVCIDVTALMRAYGPASLPENYSRIDRIFSHEYTHLLHKEWVRRNEFRIRDARDEILWECLYEGIGMYRSLNDKWKPVGGKLPAVTLQTLDKLTPIFTHHIRKIQAEPHLEASEKINLQKNLSRGKVNQKWGAFPVAIWLLLESKGDDSNLQHLIDMGPEAVLALGRKYIAGAGF